MRAMAFSPDSSRLAIAQSDNIVFIYKLGSDWGEKKSICNKFLQSSSVTCLVWPTERHNDLFIGTAEGKVRVCMCKTNKSQSLFGQESFVTTISYSPDSVWIVAGFLDCSLMTFNLDTKTKNRIMHSAIPYALSWGTHILAAGNDGKIAFYEPTGDCF